MKCKKWGQRILATSLSAGLGLGLVSCSTSNTIDYLYLLSTKNNPGQVNVFRVDSETGALTQIPNSPYPAGRNPVGLAVSPNGLNLYVINHDDNTVESFGIGTDAKLYPQHTYTTPGSEPVAVSINAAGTLLFVVDYYQPPYTDLNPGPGAVVVYPINADGSLGVGQNNGGPVAQTLPDGTTASYYPVESTPSAINVLPNGNTLYVAEILNAASAAGCSVGQGGLSALSVNSSGVLTPIAASPYCAGTTPSGIVSSPSGSALYLTDSTQNALLGYTVNSDGSLTAFAGGTIPTGEFPDGLTIDATGKYMYVANRNSNNIEGFSLGQAGVPVSMGTYQTQPYPECVIVEPNLNEFVYTADFEGVGSTGYKMDPSTGVLSGTANSPYVGTGLSTCLVATAHNKSKGSA